MPTFESSTPAKGKPSGNDDSAGSEFRPRRRDQWKRAGLDETFDPAPIPAEVKCSINQRISNLMRQCTGPDERMFAFRECMGTVRRVLSQLPVLFRSAKGGKSVESDEEEDSGDGGRDDAGSGETQDSGDGKNDSRNRNNNYQRRGRRGGKRHSRGRRGGYRNGDNGGNRRDNRDN